MLSLACLPATPSLAQEEIHPKNMLMIGPTGCGKTEIARRLAKLANAPFVSFGSNLSRGMDSWVSSGFRRTGSGSWLCRQRTGGGLHAGVASALVFHAAGGPLWAMPSE